MVVHGKGPLGIVLLKRSIVREPCRLSRPEVTIPIDGRGGQHVEIVQNFVDEILHGAELISPAVEGINSVELADATLLSAWEDKTIELPMDAAKYEAILLEKGEKSTFEKKKIEVAQHATSDDFSKSFKK